MFFGGLFFFFFFKHKRTQLRVGNHLLSSVGKLQILMIILCEIFTEYLLIRRMFWVLEIRQGLRQKNFCPHGPFLLVGKAKYKYNEIKINFLVSCDECHDGKKQGSE